MEAGKSSDRLLRTSEFSKQSRDLFRLNTRFLWRRVKRSTFEAVHPPLRGLSALIFHAVRSTTQACIIMCIQ